jgi:hypothetical protein
MMRLAAHGAYSLQQSCLHLARRWLLTAFIL